MRPRPSPEPEVAKCAVIYSSEFWVTNHTPYTVVVTATRKYSKSETYTLSLRPRETLKCGQMILAEQFDDPAKYFDISAVPKKPIKGQRFTIIAADKQPQQVAKETRRYYYEVRHII
ncbi:hypothetical protein GCM10023093_08410 [Nemorincola caseinilytica]|uniref:Uncharacterized protein n=1 Tax=Nemorincola caseinilytica TaxID=2054315 RepID=A0ABP8N6T7_9BACT